MITKELVSYIYTSRQQGVTDPIIKANLRTQGWTDVDFEEAVRTLPPKGTKVEGSNLGQLGPNVMWTSQFPTYAGQPLKDHHVFLWIGWTITIAVIAVTDYWMYMNPSVPIGIIENTRNLLGI